MTFILGSNITSDDTNTTYVEKLNVGNIITASNIGTGVDNSVVILDSDGTLRTDEIDSRVWGTSLTTCTGTVTSVSAGNGMSFTTITGSGPVTMGTPSNITLASTNSVSVGTHSHAFVPGGTTAQYIRGDGTLATFPAAADAIYEYGGVSAIQPVSGVNSATGMRSLNSSIREAINSGGLVHLPSIRT